MLVVTFTRAAAKELKSRITKKLSEALHKDPNNKYLASQLASVPAAKISTIDSFCIDVVKRNFDRLALPCGMRIADETEIALLKLKLMDAMFDDLYGKDSPFEGFEKFTDCFIADKDDSLPSRFIELYNKLSTLTEGIDFLASMADTLSADAQKPFLETLHGKYLRSYTEAFLDAYVEPSREMLRQLNGCMKCNEKYAHEYQRILDEIDLIKNALKNGDYITVQNILKNSKSIPLNGSKINLDFPMIPYQGNQKGYNDDVKRFLTEYYSESPEQIQKCYEDTEAIYRSLYRLLSSFDKRLKEEKLKRKLMDFNDVERYALELLCRDDAPTEEAKNLGLLFDEIYIDEYQDINPLQDSIFTSISGSAHRFMVGDIKQSIYGFRGSDPNLFANYRDSFPEYDEKKADKTGTIFLSNNFRCSKPVIDFCNTIFGKLMPNVFGGVSYLAEDDLVYSKNENGTPVTDPVEVICLTKGSPLSEEQRVALRIKEFIDAGYSPEDIVILLRKTSSNRAKKYEDALKAVGVPCFNAAGGDFFANPEILLMMCLLNVIDNPRRDVYLAGALQSPIFGFTLDDLVEIRRHNGGEYLYDSLLAWYTSTESPKGKHFLEVIEEMRAYAAGSPIDKLIWYIYSKTSMLSLSYNQAGGEDRRANLLMLYEHARTFENGSFKGLYNFIQYINSLIEAKSEISEAKTDTDATPTVKIMTIHKSKGLEFPICFVCGCNTEYTNYSRPDKRDDLLCDISLGIGVYTPEENGLCRINALLRRIVKLKKENDEAAEQLRLLYVALTRAKDRLIVTGKYPYSAETLYKKCESVMDIFSPYAVVSCKNYLTLIRLALMSAENNPCYKLIIEGPDDDDKLSDSNMQGEHVASDESMDNIGEVSADEQEYLRLKKLFEERFRSKYSFSAAADLPSKMAVSRLYPAVLDEDETQTPTAPMRTVPEFLEGKSKITAAERGTATHVFMQFCDFDNVAQYGIDAEIGRLINKKFIPESYAEMIRRNSLRAFFSSTLFAQMKNATELNREVRFNICMPAEDFTENDELKNELMGDTVLVQGVIDCFFSDEKGNVTIVDYKTDTFTEEQKKDPAECEKILRERHKTQLEYYRLACTNLLGKAPARTLIWSFDLEKEIEI